MRNSITWKSASITPTSLNFSHSLKLIKCHVPRLAFAWLAAPCYWEVEEGQKSIPLNQHIKHCFNDVVVCLFFLFRLLVFPKIGWGRRKERKIISPPVETQAWRSVVTFPWNFLFLFARASAECMQAQLISTPTFNSSSASRLHPFRYSRPESVPLCGSLWLQSQNRCSPEKITLRSLQLSVIQQGGC